MMQRLLNYGFLWRTSFNLNYFPMTLSPYEVLLAVRYSTYELWGDSITSNGIHRQEIFFNFKWREIRMFVSTEMKTP
jgi:hypothetical protein